MFQSGGEIPGAIAYVMESIPEKKGLACGTVFFALINGIVLGSLIHAILVATVSSDSMLQWGWRLPFVLAGVFGFISYRLRLNLRESALFQMIQHRVEAFPIVSVFKQKSFSVIMATLAAALGASVTSLLFLFTPAYFHCILHVYSSDVAWLMAGFLFLSTCISIFAGVLVDRFGRRSLLLVLCILTLLFAYPIFYIYAYQFSYYWVALLLSAILSGFSCGVIPCLISGLFPTNIRYSGVAISYNIAMALFCGLTPLVAVALIHITGNSAAPFYYLIFAACLALIAFFGVIKSGFDR